MVVCQAPTRVASGDSYEVEWTVFSSDDVDLTTVVSGTTTGQWDQARDLDGDGHVDVVEAVEVLSTPPANFPLGEATVREIK
ncbi:MAG: hypothetical protein JKY65_30515 [Planctomycetes bacterium]|nr:hypothetical protein [Planctomycetota bacterium]